MAGALAVLAAASEWRGHGGRALVLGALAVGFALIAVAAPVWLGPTNRAWFRLGMLLGRIVSPVVLAIMFYLVVTPVALLMRWRGSDPLRLRFDKDRPSYWIERTPPGPAQGSMRNQF